MVSFFGMNVETFSRNPPIKWFFISAVPFMVLVLGLWFLLKQTFAMSRLTPTVPRQRGAYEAMSAELRSRRPDLWMPQGPREYVRPADRASELKLALIRRWTAIVVGRNAAEPVDSWSRLKHRLIRRWTDEIVLAPPEPGPESGASGGQPGQPGPVPVAPTAPAAGTGIHTHGKTVGFNMHEVPDDDDAEANANAMVEERPAHLPRREDEPLAHLPVSGTGGKGDGGREGGRHEGKTDK